MPPYRKPLEVDSGRIFRWSFFIAFLVLECLVWRRSGNDRCGGWGPAR